MKNQQTISIFKTYAIEAFMALCLILSGTLAFGQDSEVREVRDFDAIKASHGIEVELVAGKMGEVVVEAKFVDLDDISTYVERGVLKIRFRNVKLWDNERHGRYIKVIVPFETLTEVMASTGAIVRSLDVIETDDLFVDATMGAEMDLRIKVDRLRSEFSMGAVVKIEGSTRTAQIKANMGAVVDMKDLDAEEAYVKGNMGSDIQVSASREVDAVAVMGAVIKVVGNPEKRYISDSFGGEVYIRKAN